MSKNTGLQGSWCFVLLFMGSRKAGLLLLFSINMLSGYTDCGGSIICGILIVKVSVHPCLLVTKSSHKLSGALFQQHFVMY